MFKDISKPQFSKPLFAVNNSYNPEAILLKMKPKALDKLYTLSKPFIFGLHLDAETMHQMALRQIENLDTENLSVPSFDSLKVNVFGQTFSSPLLLAAGFDKEARVTDKIPYLGFAGEVVGSFTALPSGGNPRPRLWRLVEESAALNRMGLNNHGVEAGKERLQPLEDKVCFAVSIAKTNNPTISGDYAIRDYVSSYGQLKNLGIFTELDISCPNTEDGRTFAEPHALSDLLAGLESESKGKPRIVKLPPNLTESQLSDIVKVSEDFVDGYAGVNTESYVHPIYGQIGRSGKPLENEALRTIGFLRKITIKPLIGIGGIFTGRDAFNFLEAGADLLEGFTGFIYRGPLYAAKVASELAEELKAKRFEDISQLKEYSR